MYTQVLEFSELPPHVRFPKIEVHDICQPLADIVNFLEKWCSESYHGYYLASAIGLVSIISARRVEYLFGSRGATNLYIMLVDTSGISAKTMVINNVRAIIRALNLDFLLLPDSITSSKMFSSMSIKLPEEWEKLNKNQQNKLLETIQKNQAFLGQRGLVYDEFGKLIREMNQSNHHNSGFRELLKKLYDNQPELMNSTQVRDNEIIKNPFLALLGGMTPRDLAPYAKKGSPLWGDGFLSRIAFICPPENFRKDIPLPDGDKKIPNSIITHLKEWHIRLGIPEIKITSDIEVIPAKGQLFEITGDVKDAVYEYRYSLKDMLEKFENKDLIGNYIRFAEMGVRVSSLVASLNGDDKVNLDHWAFGQNTVEEWRRDLHQLYFNSLPEKNPKITDPMEKILAKIKEKGPISSRGIQLATHFKCGSTQLILDKLVQEGKIKSRISGKETLFSLVDENPEV